MHSGPLSQPLPLPGSPEYPPARELVLQAAKEPRLLKPGGDLTPRGATGTFLDSINKSHESQIKEFFLSNFYMVFPQHIAHHRVYMGGVEICLCRMQSIWWGSQQAVDYTIATEKFLVAVIWAAGQNLNPLPNEHWRGLSTPCSRSRRLHAGMSIRRSTSSLSRSFAYGCSDHRTDELTGFFGW